MADYIYLLETRLSKAQRSAIEAVREVARGRATMLFLVGGAVRDLTSGSPVRDLDVVVQGNALKMKKELEKAGALVVGENEPGQALYLSFAGSVRMEVGSTLSATYPKPGKPVLKPASLLDDLRRRDFTANAMALSLNEGSYGLLMDPLNGVADIENRELRLASNYGFIEDPARMLRAARLMARLGWTMEEKTQARYEAGKQEGYIGALSSFHRGYETEEIFHEEDPLRVIRRLEEERWMQHLSPALSFAKANVPEMERLREAQTQLQMQGILTDASAANFPLLTGKLSQAEIRELKGMFPRQGFVAQIDKLEAEAKEFATHLLAKNAALPSQAFQLIHHAKPEAVLWAAHTSKSAALQSKLKSFYTEWPQARQRIPYVLMQEMRIVPELAIYEGVVESLFYALMDGRLGTVEDMRAFLEPHSPPAPPPPVHLRRQRAAKKDAKAGKGRKKSVASVDLGDEEDIDQDDSQSGEDGDESEVAAVSEESTEDATEIQAEELEEIQPVIEPSAPRVESPAPASESPAPASETPAPATKVARGRSESTKVGVAAKVETPRKPAVQTRMAPASPKAPSVSVKVAAPPAKPTRQPISAAPARKAASAPVEKRPSVKAHAVVASRPAPGKKGASAAPRKAVPAGKKSAAPAKAPAKKAVKAAAAKKSTAHKAVAPAKKTAKVAPPPPKKAVKKGR